MFEKTKTKAKSSISFKEFQEKINVINNFENDWGYFYDPDININININTNSKFIPKQYFQPKKQEEIFINIEKIYNKKKETDTNVKESQDINVKESQDDNNVKESQDINVKESQDINVKESQDDKNKTIMSWAINNILDHCELILITAIMFYFINNNI